MIKRAYYFGSVRLRKSLWIVDFFCCCCIMSKSFEEILLQICQKLLLSDSDRESYAKDVESIQNYIINAMKGKDTDFSRAFRGLSLTGSYLDDLKINAPDEFDVHIKLEPYQITPKADKSRPGFLFLQVDPHIHHRTVENGWINRKKLQSWIRELLVSVFDKEGGIQVGTRTGRVYRVTYSHSHRGYGVAHTIHAKDVKDSHRTIDFDFVPVFEFGANKWCLPSILLRFDLTWFGVPQGIARHELTGFGVPQGIPKDNTDAFTFMVCAPHHERELLKNKMSLKNSLRLMKAIKDANGISHLSSYMLKSVYLMQLDEPFKRSDDYWKLPMGYVLLEMLQCVCECLAKNNLPFYWDKKLNHLQRLSSIERVNYEKKISEILHRLRSFSFRTDLAFADVATIFGVK